MVYHRVARALAFGRQGVTRESLFFHVLYRRIFGTDRGVIALRDLPRTAWKMGSRFVGHESLFFAQHYRGIIKAAFSCHVRFVCVERHRGLLVLRLRVTMACHARLPPLPTLERSVCLESVAPLRSRSSTGDTRRSRRLRLCAPLRKFQQWPSRLADGEHFFPFRALRPIWLLALVSVHVPCKITSCVAKGKPKERKSHPHLTRGDIALQSFRLPISRFTHVGARWKRVE